jgi:hypothetical protein
MAAAFPNPAALLDETAKQLNDGSLIGWHEIAESRRYLLAFRFLVLSNLVSAEIMAGSLDSAIGVCPKHGPLALPGKCSRNGSAMAQVA